MEKDFKSLVVIPVYNEYSRIRKTIKNCSIYFENILVVDDGSEDKSLEEIKKSDAKFILKHLVNCGQGASILTGVNFFLSQTQFKYLITFDADGQHQSLDAFKMLNYAYKNNIDAVFGSRFLNKENAKYIPLHRKIVLKLAILFERIFFKIYLTDSNNGLRVLNRKTCSKLLTINSAQMAHATEIAKIISKESLSFYEYPVRVIYNKAKKNGQNFLSSLNIISDLLQKK